MSFVQTPDLKIHIVQKLTYITEKTLFKCKSASWKKKRLSLILSLYLGVCTYAGCRHIDFLHCVADQRLLPSSRDSFPQRLLVLGPGVHLCECSGHFLIQKLYNI